MSPPRFSCQFSFGQDAKLAGRFSLNGLPCQLVTSAP
jgi:hypothetical protein